WAPDDQHIALNVMRNFETEIMVFNVEAKEKINLSNTAVSENAPFWSADGKYLYFHSNLTKPSYPYGLQNPDLFKVPLEKFDTPFKSDKFDELFAEEAEDEQEAKKEEDEDGADEKEVEEKVVVTIDQNQIMDRKERIGPAFGSQFGMIAIKNENKEIVLFSSNHDEGDFALYKWEKAPFEKAKTKKIEGTEGGNYYFSWTDEKYYVLNGGNIHELKVDDNKVAKIDISLKFQRNLQAEFEQMFYETWAGMETNFYDENFHGEDWSALRDEYAQFLPYLNNRADLRLLLNDLLGELNTSHFGFRSSGKEEGTYYGTSTMATGILFATDNPYQVQSIIAHSPADRKGKDVQAGDELIAVNGKVVDKTHNREHYFAQPSRPEELTLTFLRAGKKIDVKLHPISYLAQRRLLYDEWMQERQEIVDTEGDKKIAYVHMKNMGGGELQRFLQEMVSEGQQRDGLILDLRYNTGGNVHDAVLQFLSQKPYLQWKYREGALTPQPNFSPAAKPIVLLINEQSLSDAEMTATGFKALGLGTIMGTETYRWIIFTSGKGLVDGSFYRLPSWGCYTLDGDNIEKTGVAPDVFVQNTFEDRVKGDDPQLERAIELVLGKLE
ncbi:MAG: S41 family peptidase, partial [Bacteroidota bacterium]